MVEETSTPVILVVVSAGPVDLRWAKEHVHAILWTGYAGEYAGLAIAEALIGKFNPGGALPYTWVGQDYADITDFADMSMRPNATTGFPGRTHRFLNESRVSPIWPFAYGESYTKFSIEFVHQSDSKSPRAMISSQESTHWTVRVSNVGHVPGSVVVICHVSFEGGGANGIPRRSLFGFDRTKTLSPKGESQSFHFELQASQRAITNIQGEWTYPEGLYDVECEAGVVVSTGKRQFQVIDSIKAAQ